MTPSRTSLPRVLTRSIAGLIASMAILPMAKAQTFTWTGDSNGSWGTAARWQGGTVANGVDSIADFSTVNITAARTITLDGNRTVGTLKFGDAATASHDWTVNVGTPTTSTITLDVSSGFGTIDVTNRTVTITTILAGSDGLRKIGAGTARLNAVNTITGDLAVDAGTLQIGNSTGINTLNPIINVNNNGTSSGGNGSSLHFIDSTLGSGRTINLNSGTGDNRVSLIGQNSNWQGSVVLGGSAPVAINATTSTFTISGNVTAGAGTPSLLFLRGAGTGVINGTIDIPTRVFKTDAGTWTINTTGNNWTTSTQVADGQLQLGITNALPTTLPLIIGQGSGTNGRFEMNGFSQSVVGLRTDPASTGLNHIIRNSSLTSASTLNAEIATGTTDIVKNTQWQNLSVNKTGTGRLQLDDNRVDQINFALNDGELAFGGVNVSTLRMNVTGAATTVVEKVGIGTTQVHGSFNHAGQTKVTDGRLDLSNGTTGAISVADNATFGIGANSGQLTASSVTLGSAGTATLAANLTTPGGSSLMHANSLTTSGVNTSVIFEGANLATGTYPLFTYGGGSIGGNGFNGLVMGAAGLNPHVTASLVNNVAQNRVDLNITAVDSLIWSGLNGNIWDVNGTTNFKLASNNADATFFQSDRVLFNDAGANRTINTAGNIRVGNVTFDHSAGNDYVIMGSLSGPGNITKNGTGATRLGAVPVLPGSGGSISGNGSLVTVVTSIPHGYLSGQRVTISNSNIGYNGTFQITVVDANTFTYGATTTGVNTRDVTTSAEDVQFAITGGITINGGEVILGGTNSVRGPVNVNAGGLLKLARTEAIGGGADVRIANGATLDVNGQGVPNVRVSTLRVSGAGFDGNGAIVNNGLDVVNINHALNIILEGDTTWGGSNRYDISGTTFVNGGNFNLTKVGAGQMWYTPAAGSTLGNVTVNQGVFGVQSTNPLATTSTVTINGGAFHNLFGSVSTQHPIVVNDGATMQSTSGTPIVNGTVTLNGAGTAHTLGATSGTTLAVAGQITGSGGFNKTDAGTLQIRNSTNNYSGDTILTAGNINFSANGALPIGTNLIINGGTFDPSGLTITVGSLSGTGGNIVQATANTGIIVTTQSTDTTYLGQLTRTHLRMNGTGTLTLGGTTDNSTGTAEVNSGTLILAKSGDFATHGVGAAGVGLIINANGTVKLGGPQPTTGGTGSNVPPAGAPGNYVDQIFNFTDVVMAPASGPAPGAVFDLTGFSEAIDGLTGGGKIRTSVAGAANSKLYVGYNNAPGDFTGVIENGAGVVELEKLGTGTFIVRGVNTYTGSTTVNGGVLANLGSLATTALTANNGTVVFSPGPIAGSVTLNGNALYLGAPTGAIGGAVTLNGTSSFNGAVAVGGNLTVNIGTVFNGLGNIGGNATIGGVYNGGGNVAGTITGNNGSTISIAGPTVATVTAGGLTFPAAATRTLNIGLSATAADRINTASANGLTLDGTTNVVVQPGAGGWITGTYPIIGYNGAVQGAGVSSLQLQGATGHSTVTIVDNGTGTISLQVNGIAVKWTGSAGPTWDTNSTLNWTSPDQRFLAGDAVRFDDTASAFSPTINANVSPASVTFDTANNNYTLAGTAGITTGSLWKLGTGTATITNPNTYTGPTGVQAGTLSAVYGAVVPISAASTIDIAANGTFKANSPNANFTFANTVTGTGTLVLDANNGGAAGDREITLTGNLSNFAGTVKLSPTPGNGTFRVQVDSGVDMGVQAVVDVDEGGQVYYTTSGMVVANPIMISGTGFMETSGNLGALRGTNTTFTNDIVVSGAAKIGALNSTVTFTDSISGGDLTLGGNNTANAETFVLLSNVGILNSLTVNDGLASAGAATITLSVGDGGTNGSLGTVPVTLVGDGFKTAAIRFDRSNGYTLNGPISSVGTSSRTDIQIDTLGTGFNSNSQPIELGGGTFRIGVNRQNAVATITGILNAGPIRVGALNAARSTTNAVLNLSNGAVVSASVIEVSSGGNGATAGFTNGGTLNISGNAVVTAANIHIGEQNSSNGTINQSGGDVSVSGQFRVGHWPNNTSVYNMSGGTLTMTGFPGQFPYASTASETNGGMYLGIDGTGVVNQSGGTVKTNFVVLDQRGNTAAGFNTPTGVDTYNLSGGELRITNEYGIISRNPSAAFNLSGGSIIAETNFNLDTNKISVNGLTGIDTAGFVVTNFGPFGGNSTIAITGAGTFTNAESASLESGTNIAFRGGSLGSVNAAIANGTTLQSDRISDDVWNGVLSGVGKVLKTNTGTLTLTGNSGATFTGPVSVDGGKLVVNGNLTGSIVTVNTGGTLGGIGTIGPVDIKAGGSVAPGVSVGTLTTGELTLEGTSKLQLELAAPGVVGGPNDLLTVNGSLKLDGTLQVTTLAGFGIGTYRLIDYTGLLNNQTLDLESAFLALYPGSSIDTSVAGQVNLVVVPEPGSLAGLLGGIGALMGLRRFRRRA